MTFNLKSRASVLVGAFVAWALPFSALAATVAIIDSGTDYLHPDMAAQYEINQTPSQGKQYKDDVYGWNFAENSNVVIDYSYIDRLEPSMRDIHRFFEVQVKMMEKTAEDWEIAWMKSMRDDEAFIK